MKTGITLAGLVLLAAVTTPAKDSADYDKGQLLSMDSKACGSAQNGSKTLAGELLGTDGEHRKTHELLCQEYVLQGDRIVYRIRPKDDKHPVLLPVGESVQFRIHKDKMHLRNPEGDKKEREYLVISMQPRQDVKDLRASK
ncbi:MAG: hypothetical protein WBP79_14690 [Candidatus Acidiferrales bacterium]